jgi:dTDP-4-dehydrorhamnose reductase
VDTVLIAGLDSVVGANLALELSSTHQVVGVCLDRDVSLSGVSTPLARTASIDTLRNLVEQCSPARIIFCGVASRSCWGPNAIPSDSDVLQLQTWLTATAGSAAQWTYISSDAVFTGPWMFHAENSHSLCASPAAQLLRSLEEKVMAARPETLIVRTHALGWSAGDVAGNWIEAALATLEAQRHPQLDCVRHASPLIVADLARVLQKAWLSGLAGCYHIAGAERINPVQLFQRLAADCGLTYLPVANAAALTDCAAGFGNGETSLQTRKIRRALHIGLPLVSDGLQQLAAQRSNGHYDRLTPAGLPRRAKVA